VILRITLQKARRDFLKTVLVFCLLYLKNKACWDFGTGILEMTARVMLYEKLKPENGKF
jgi:hypothetical protein